MANRRTPTSFTTLSKPLLSPSSQFTDLLVMIPRDHNLFSSAKDMFHPNIPVALPSRRGLRLHDGITSSSIDIASDGRVTLSPRSASTGHDVHSIRDGKVSRWNVTASLAS